MKKSQDVIDVSVGELLQVQSSYFMFDSWKPGMTIHVDGDQVRLGSVLRGNTCLILGLTHLFDNIDALYVLKSGSNTPGWVSTLAFTRLPKHAW